MRKIVCCWQTRDGVSGCWKQRVRRVFTYTTAIFSLNLIRTKEIRGANGRVRRVYSSISAKKSPGSKKNQPNDSKELLGGIRSIPEKQVDSTAESPLRHKSVNSTAAGSQMKLLVLLKEDRVQMLVRDRLYSMPSKWCLWVLW